MSTINKVTGMPHRFTPAAALALFIAACGGGTLEAASSATLRQPTACAGLPSTAAMLKAINDARSVARSCGGTAYAATTPLAWNAALAGAAQGHADDMAQRNYFSHASADGRTVDQRAQSAGYSGGTLGENISAGRPSLDATLSSWLTSAGHCANLMNPAYRDVGLGCARADGTQYGIYWVQLLGAQN